MGGCLSHVVLYFPAVHAVDDWDRIKSRLPHLDEVLRVLHGEACLHEIGVKVEIVIVLLATTLQIGDVGSQVGRILGVLIGVGTRI